jgi:predicted dehydrogenase
VIGVGFVGDAHIDAIGRLGIGEVAAVAASSPESARRAAERHRIPRAHAEWRALIEDPEIDVVHNCTPNALHGEVGRAALAAGRHLVTEKPLAATLDDATALAEAASRTSLVTALCHNYRQYPMVREAHALIRAGAIGEIHQVHGVYLQDWLSDPAARNWRLEPGEGGASITFADIGTHWCDLAMHLLGRRIEALCATTGGLYGRDGDDHSGVLLRFEGGTLGSLVASQVSPGAKNRLRIRFDGADGSIAWDQERPEELWLGSASGPSELRHKSPDELHPAARAAVRLPAGHFEGWNGTFVNLFGAVYRTILRTPEPGDDSVATLAEGMLLMHLVDAVGRSEEQRAWVRLPALPGYRHD